MKKFFLALPLVLLLSSCETLYSLTKKPESHITISGSVIIASEEWTGFSECVTDNKGRLADIQTNAILVVKDENGKILGSGLLGQGKVSFVGGNCVFNFAIDVEESEFYTLILPDGTEKYLSRSDAWNKVYVAF